MDLKLFFMGKISDMTAENTQCATEFITGCMYASVATNNKETGARLSYMSKTHGTVFGEFLFSTETSSQKILNLVADPACEIGFTNGQAQVFLSGYTEICIDIATKKSVWSDEMSQHFTDGIEGDSWCVIRFKATGIRAMI